MTTNDQLIAAPGSYSADAELRQLHERWWRRQLPRAVVNSDCGLYQRFRHIPALPRQWLGFDGLLLEPEMLSAPDFQPEPWLPETGIAWRGLTAFNTMTPYLRVPWLVGIMGCAMRVSTVSETVWPVAYLPDDWHARPDQGFAPRLEWLDKLLEFLRYIVSEFSPSRCLAAPDMIARGPGDLLVAMLGTERCYLELYDHPDEIARLLERITDLYIEWGKTQLEVIPRFMGGYCNQYGLWTPGPIVRTQEDYAVNISPEVFRKFILPCTRRVVEAFEWQVVHTHSATHLAEWLVDLPGLTALEFAIDPSGPTLDELLPRLGRILERVPVIVLGSLSQRQVDFLARELPGGGLWFDVEIVPEGADVAEFSWVER
jgi:hypothetical protein